jgi:hypothetical protein
MPIAEIFLRFKILMATLSPVMSCSATAQSSVVRERPRTKASSGIKLGGFRALDQKVGERTFNLAKRSDPDCPAQAVILDTLRRGVRHGWVYGFRSVMHESNPNRSLSLNAYPNCMPMMPFKQRIPH